MAKNSWKNFKNQLQRSCPLSGSKPGSTIKMFENGTDFVFETLYYIYSKSNLLKCRPNSDGIVNRDTGWFIHGNNLARDLKTVIVE